MEDQQRYRNVYQTGDEPTFPEKCLVVVSWLAFVFFFPISLFFTIAAIPQYQRAIILRNGRVYKRKVFGPGLIFFLPCVDSVSLCDLRTVAHAVPPQEVLTKDSLSVTVDAVILYKMTDPLAAFLNVADHYSATQLFGATTLRNAIGTRYLSDFLKERTAVSNEVLEIMKRATADWGVSVLTVDIKEVSLPLQLQKAMAAEAESARLVNAKIIVAEAEINATQSLEKATTLLTESPYAMQLRYLQSLHTITNSRTQTYVIPISNEVFSTFLKG